MIDLTQTAAHNWRDNLDDVLLDIATIEGRCESIGKRRQRVAVNVRWRNQVKPAAKPVVFICHPAQNLP